MLRNDSINRARFDSLTELADYLQPHLRTCQYLEDSSPRFYGSTNGEQALRFARLGDERNVAAAQAMLDKFSAELELTTVADEATVAGCYPVVAEFLSGEPECMRLPSASHSESAPLSIFVDLTCSATIRPEQMRQRGIAVLAAVLALSARRPVTLEVGCVMGAHKSADGLGKDRVSMVSAVLDTAPLDLATAAWVLSDVAAARRLMYGASLLMHEFDGNWPRFRGAGYGAVESDAHCARVRELLDLPGETLYVPAVSNTDDGNYAEVFKSPITWVESIVRRFGGAVRDL